MEHLLGLRLARTLELLLETAEEEATKSHHSHEGEGHGELVCLVTSLHYYGDSSVCMDAPPRCVRGVHPGIRGVRG